MREVDMFEPRRGNAFVTYAMVDPPGPQRAMESK